MTSTGAEAGSNPVPAGPVVITATNEFGAAPSRSSRLMVRGIIAGILAVLAGAGAWLLLRHGVRTDTFPPFLADTESTPITRYSGPWITAAAAVALLAALLLLSAALDVIRWATAKRRATG